MVRRIKFTPAAYFGPPGLSRGSITYAVSYVGQWKHKEIGAHIREFWTHVPGRNGLLTEIAAINGNIFLSITQDYKEDKLYKAFLRELDELGIPYTEKRTMANDVPRFDEP